MADVKKVIKGLKCCIGDGAADTPGCEDCPYNDDGDTCVSIRPLYEDTIELLKEYDDALKLMVFQYCTMKPLTAHDEVFHNKCMSAGEAAFRLLGLENGQSTDGVWGRWFPNG